MLKAAWLTLSKTFGLETRGTISAPDSALFALFGASVPSASGIAVSPLTASRCAAVRRAVAVISETLATLPAGVYEIATDGSRKPATTHPLHRLLSVAANPWTPTPKLIEQLIHDALLHGNSFCFVNRRDGIPVELLHLRPEQITVTYDTTTSEPFYQLTSDLGRAVSREDVIHLQAASLDGVMGLSPVVEARESIGLCLIMEAHAARLFAKGSRPSGILSTEKSLGEQTLKRLAASWAALNSGENAGSAAILEEGMKWQALAFSSVDSQFLEIWKHAIHDVCRAFGVPPSIVYELDRATWGNASEMDRHFLKYTLSRWIKALEGELSLKLLREDERDRFTIELDTDVLLRADLGARAAAYAQLRASGVVTANEIRAWENLPPHKDGDKLDSPHVQSGKSNTGAEANVQ